MPPEKIVFPSIKYQLSLPLSVSFSPLCMLSQVLHWLAAMKPADVAARLMPMLIHAAIVKLSEQGEAVRK